MLCQPLATFLPFCAADHRQRRRQRHGLRRGMLVL
jgi:hypothetical protein